MLPSFVSRKAGLDAAVITDAQSLVKSPSRPSDRLFPSARHPIQAARNRYADARLPHARSAVVDPCLTPG